MVRVAPAPDLADLVQQHWIAAGFAVAPRTLQRLFAAHVGGIAQARSAALPSAASH